MGTGAERDEAAEARALAAAWALAAAGFRDPDDGLGAALSDREFLEEAGKALDFLDPGGREGLLGAWNRFRKSAAAAGRAGLGRERARLLGHAVRGPCPPYEIEYGNEHFLGKSRRLGDVAAFYRAFGVEVSRSAREREDHAAMEAEFLSLLSLKRALAAERGDGSRASVCRDAERLFLEEHIGRFLPSFARRVEEREPDSALAAAARLAAGTAAIHGSLVEARLGSPDLELRELGTLEEETVVSCSPCSVPGASAGPGSAGDVEV